MMQRLLITTLCALAFPAFAAYPEKPVRLIVPLAAGGGMDTTARSIATPLGERLGQTVVVDNRPGGGGNVGVDILHRDQPTEAAGEAAQREQGRVLAHHAPASGRRCWRWRI